jgi:2-dehydro-3-deoxyphosphogluconate aldolase/(4S)-4-hydroxy-2-oxoglutarate aldolase
MPTGGLRPVCLNAYLTLTNVFAIGGTWIAPRDAIEEGRFGAIADAARAAVSTVATFRATAQAEATPRERA